MLIYKTNKFMITKKIPRKIYVLECGARLSDMK